MIRALELNGPNHLGSDEGFLFLALITDKRSRKVVGHHCAHTLQAGGCVKPLNSALRERLKKPDLFGER